MSLYTDEISLKKLWLWLRSRLVLASGARALSRSEINQTFRSVTDLPF